jgi:acyl-homoserine-lactone acylase
MKALLQGFAWALALPSLAVFGHNLLAERADATQRWQIEARDTTITRDDWGIAHVHGKSDADAVFGAVYAQAEDDFKRVETNYLTTLGRLSEAEGEKDLYQDLRARLFSDPEDLRARYAASPAWLRQLMDAWADGLNVYLRAHRAVVPRVIRTFEPWMALSFSEGSIEGDTERVELRALRQFYGPDRGSRARENLHSQALAAREEQSVEPGGSNGIAIAPANARDHHALLLINPHTSFYFRSELQMTSDAGLNAYGAVTWGQFFIYQGFNERLGWMHTSSGVDNVDFFLETIVKRDGSLYYRYGRELRPVRTSKISIRYRTPTGDLATKTFIVYRTHHGPIVAQRGDKWVSIALMQRPVEALSQSFLLTKARDYAAFMQVMELQANSSNNTVLADADGDIAYLHPQFIPRRDGRFDYTHPVDGSNPATDWKGLHTLVEVPHVLNPPNGWIMNTNDWPYSAAGPYSPKREQFPRYMDTAGENPRGIHATMLLKDRKDFTLSSLQAAAFDSYLPALARLIPMLLAAYDARAAQTQWGRQLAAPSATLRAWDDRWAPQSVATTLAVLWGDELWAQSEGQAKAAGMTVYDYIAARTTPEQKLTALAAVCRRLAHDFGDWKVPWGEFNRFQRLNDDIVQKFSDSAASIPVPFTGSRWGSLASFAASRYEGTKRYYGTRGNSFVAIVEFGGTVSARAVSTGGASGDPRSRHFDDQAERYAAGNLREVYFYPAQLARHTERSYHPNSEDPGSRGTADHSLSVTKHSLKASSTVL